MVAIGNIEARDCPVGPLIQFGGEIMGQTCRVLLDCGASLNFIATRAVERLKLDRSKLNRALTVSMADGQKHKVEYGIRDLEMQIPFRNCTTTLVEMPLDVYDVILGMPWLRKYNPYIDWETGRISQLKVPSEPANSEERDRIVGLGEERPKGLVTSVEIQFDRSRKLYADKEIQSPLIRDVVHKFQDTFHDPSNMELPPSRAIDHRIQLLP